VVLGEQISTHAASSLRVVSYAMSSTSVALAVPPPSHMVCSAVADPVVSHVIDHARHQDRAGRAKRVTEGQSRRQGD